MNDDERAVKRMARFPAAWLDELRSRADIVQIVGQYVSLKRNGHRHWGLCPFHGEKTASFSVDQERQMYYCFGCKAGGSVIQFVMDIERLEFQDAVKHLADQLHMPLPQLEEDPEYQRRRTQRDRLLEANKEAARFFHQTLFTPQGQSSLDYLKRRGLTDNIIRKFGLGAAPAGWDTLTKHLQQQGYSLEELRLAGLTVIKEAEPAATDPATGEEIPGKPRRAFDMFRNRAIFPIIDQYGNVLAFGGRALGDVQPKYLNTSDTPVFNKRLGVYAANLLKKERNLKRVILVEGYMDVVSLTQFGVAGVCATLGTALTPEQAKLLKRFAPMVYLSYDGDNAGQNAIMKGLTVLEEAGVPARVLQFPDKLDPDEFIRRDGLEGFERLPALTPESYRIRRLREQYDLSSQEGRTDYARACAAILQKVDPVERENHLQELILQTGFSREVLLAQIGVNAPSVGKPAAPASPAAKPRFSPNRTSPAATEEERDEELLISIFGTGRVPTDIATEEDFRDPLLRNLYLSLCEGASAAALAEEQVEEMTRARVSKLLLTPPVEDTDQLIRMAQDCLDRNRLKRSRAELSALEARLSSLSGSDKLNALQRAQQLSAQISKLTAHRS
ncbi:MAG: DNA primase [Clostridia bacterium]|nr:DNA primase [Clostridia bacterium]